MSIFEWATIIIRLLTTINTFIIAKLKINGTKSLKIYEHKVQSLIKDHRKIQDLLVESIDIMKSHKYFGDRLKKRLRMTAANLNIFDKAHIVSSNVEFLINRWETHLFLHERGEVDDGSLDAEMSECIILADSIKDEADKLLDTVWKND